MRWTVHLEGGPRRVNHAAVCIREKIYSFGGYCSTDEYKDWEAIPVHVLNTNTLRWSPVVYKRSDVIPFQRYGHSAVPYGEKIYMWGGRNNAVACDTLSCFDSERLEWTNPKVTGTIPHAKDGHSACIIKNKMYIFGGFEYLTDQYSQEVHCIDLDTMIWTFLHPSGTPPTHRDFHTAVSVDDRMYIFGGRGDLNSPYNSHEEIYCPQVYYLDTTKNAWVTCNANGVWPVGRRSHSAWLHNDFMYIFGGFNGSLKTHFNDVYRYSIKKNFWEHVEVRGTEPCKRRRQACLLYEDKVYMFGGTRTPSVLERLVSLAKDSLGSHTELVTNEFPCPTPRAATQPADNNDEHEAEVLVDNSDLHVLDYNPSLRTLCIMSVLEHKLDTTSLPWNIKMDIVVMTAPNHISRPINQSG